MFDGNGISRRSFLKQSGAGLVAASAFPTIIPSRAFGAADRINVAVVGLHGRGGSHLSAFPRIENVHLHTIVDIDRDWVPSAVGTSLNILRLLTPRRRRRADLIC